jgi:hypothetical protein
MPDWLIEHLSTAAEGLILAILTGVFVELLQMRGARKRLVALQVGKAVTFDASLRASAAPYPRRWRAGWLTVNAGPPTWKPRFSVMRRPVVLPMSATVQEIRDVGLKEGFSVSHACRVIVARAGDLNLELAVFPVDLTTAQQAIESGSAGPRSARLDEGTS